LGSSFNFGVDEEGWWVSDFWGSGLRFTSRDFRVNRVERKWGVYCREWMLGLKFRVWGSGLWDQGWVIG
jgi:hypothetical protein